MIFATNFDANHITEMKNLVLFLCFFLLASSCEKNQTVPDDEVPGWLKTRIAQDELTIASNPQSGLDIAAWIRYKYQKEYYFEYHNMLFSSFPPVYNYAGRRSVTSLIHTRITQIKNAVSSTFGKDQPISWSNPA